jgi:hypothetical protein
MLKRQTGFIEIKLERRIFLGMVLLMNDAQMLINRVWSDLMKYRVPDKRATNNS